MQKCIQRGLSDRSHGDKILAQPAALRELTFERFGNVLDGDQFGLDEQVS
jgi:hypothetical protein